MLDPTYYEAIEAVDWAAQQTKKIIVSVSGGLGSAYALKMCVDRYGKENVIAVFADVKGTGNSHFWSDFPHLEYLLHERYGGETRDTYRFLWQVAYALDIPIIHLEDGRSIWSVFAEKKMFSLMMGKTLVCKASELLKRQVIADWIDGAGLIPGTYSMALGMGVLEGHRVLNAQGYWRSRLGWDIEVFSPMINLYRENKTIIDDCTISDWLHENGITAPGAYARNHQHNNCAGICVHAGQNQYAEIYKNDHEQYMYAAYQEDQLRRKVGINASILKMERNGKAYGVTLHELIDYIERDEINERDLGGSCVCFTGSAELAKFIGSATPKLDKKKLAKSQRGWEAA